MKTRWESSATKQYNRFPHQDRINGGIFDKSKEKKLCPLACNMIDQSPWEKQSAQQKPREVLKHQVPM